jgi:hypothetical protein
VELVAEQIHIVRFNGCLQAVKHPLNSRRASGGDCTLVASGGYISWEAS